MTYSALESHHRRLGHLQHVASIVAWDEAVMMPEGGGEKRAEATATLRVLMHDLGAAPELGDYIAKAESEPLDPWQAANVREARRLWLRETALPGALVAAAAQANLRSEQAWRSLRARNGWAEFRPLLEEVVKLQREVAQALSARLDCAPYDALVDGYEPGITSADIDRVFGELESFLPALIAKGVERQAPVAPLGRTFSIEAQRALGLRLMAAIGFDLRHGRLDVSHHPFCGGVPTDVRITTRYREDDFFPALMGVLHETGHAKYEQGLPRAFIEQPVGAPRSMAVHESQSLFQELQVCRSREFFTFAAPMIAETLNAPELTAERLTALATRVKRGFIRVDADELTYPGHIVLRYQLERDLIQGKLAVRDLPEAWDAQMQRWFGLSTLGNDKDGCMQDVHWPQGAIGYFPSYALGAILAAQLFAAVSRALPAVRADIARGDFAALNEWLRANIWSKASSLPTPQLIAAATGEPLSARHLRAHLEARYL